MTKRESKIILVDMDDTIADVEGEFLSRWRTQHPGKMYIPLEQRNTHFVEGQYPEDLHKDILKIYSAKGFFEWLPAKEGAVDALWTMHYKGHAVLFCTAPMLPYENSVPEKFKWVERHFNPEWTQRIIIARDKTLVRGHYLIDDKPEIKGARQPVWEHVIADMPYNRHVTGKKRITDWSKWAEVLELD